MNGQAPRLRMFAGPNDSGKSSIKSVIGRELLGVEDFEQYAVTPGVALFNDIFSNDER